MIKIISGLIKLKESLESSKKLYILYACCVFAGLIILIFVYRPLMTNLHDMSKKVQEVEAELLNRHRVIAVLEKLKEEFGLLDELFNPPLSTFEPTKMEANVPNVNTIPGRNVFYIDCRVLPQYQIDEIMATARKIAQEVADGLDLSIQVEAVYRQDATNPTPSDAPVVKALAKRTRCVSITPFADPCTMTTDSGPKARFI